MDSIAEDFFFSFLFWSPSFDIKRWWGRGLIRRRRCMVTGLCGWERLCG